MDPRDAEDNGSWADSEREMGADAEKLGAREKDSSPSSPGLKAADLRAKAGLMVDEDSERSAPETPPARRCCASPPGSCTPASPGSTPFTRILDKALGELVVGVGPWCW